MNICVWCDGTWCKLDDVSEYGCMSDDYVIVRVPEELSDDEIESLLERMDKNAELSFHTLHHKKG